MTRQRTGDGKPIALWEVVPNNMSTSVEFTKRKELIRLWRENEISDEVMRHQEEILDYQEAQL